MPQVRIFYALWPEEAETQALAAACRGLFPLSGRPLDARDHHVTLAFVGRVEASRLASFLELAGPIEPFAMKFDLLEHWAKPRVLVTTTSDVPRALRAAVDLLWHRLDRLGIARDTRPLRPHVTLARDVRQWRADRPWTPVSWRAHRIRLVESQPDLLPRYRVLDGPVT
jgi:2'-5' RNA ligase